MREVWKYTLAPDTRFVDMPAGAELLTVQMQHGCPQLWALVDPEAEKESHWIRIVGTGHRAPQGGYVGTFQTDNGSLVWHVFDVVTT